jgi:NAD-dependent SIR2 family protein deacetylase
VKKCMTTEAIQLAAHTIREAGSIVITAGAGMGVDSGLPDFRGDEGFWKAYPPYRELGMSFMEMATPRWFEEDPALGWGFYGHRRNLYRATRPHRGFEILRRWTERCAGGSFVFTSNVDGHFQKAGFDPDRIIECHGSLEFEQCSANCGEGVWPAPPAPVVIDESTMRAQGSLPPCMGCGAVARPNILMFFDGGWDGCRHEEQFERLEGWIAKEGDPLVVIECGAGTAVPTVRSFSDSLGEAGTLIRINTTEPDVPTGQIGIAVEALEALEEIDRTIQSSESRSTALQAAGPQSTGSARGEVSASPLHESVKTTSGHVVDVVVQAFVMENIYSGLIDGMSEGWQCHRFDAFMKKLSDRWGSRPNFVVEPKVTLKGGSPYRPPHLCAAWLVTGGTLARQGAGDFGSELVVIWYQHYGEEGGLIPSRVANSVDWHEQAWNTDRLILSGPATSTVGPSDSADSFGNVREAIAARSHSSGLVIGSSQLVKVTIDSLVMENLFGGSIEGTSEKSQCQRFDAFLSKINERWGERRTVIVGPGTASVDAQRPGLFASVQKRLSGGWGSKRGTEAWRMETRSVGGSYCGSRRPPYLCAAWLTAFDTLAGQGSGDTYSELVVVWYQEYGEEGGLIPDRVAESIDWHADAWNCDP